MNRWHLRFAVTSNCNFNCKYCNTNNEFVPELQEQEIKEILTATYNIDIIKVHWTGGEPLVKKELYKCIQYAKELGYIEQSITTNGYLLVDQADKLIKAGISRVNISLDTLNREKFKNITGRDGLENVLRGINKILDISDFKIKINMVVMKDNLEEVSDFINFAKSINEKYKKERIIIRFLQFFPCNPNQLNEEGQKYWKDEYITEKKIINEIKKNGNKVTSNNEKIIGDNPTVKYYRVNNSLTIGILAMFSWKYPCGNCHKLRITPYGYGSCCLNDEKMYKLIDVPLEEKERILHQIIERRNTIIDERKERRHYRRKLGEVRFGEKGKQVELEKFYNIINQKEKKVNEQR